MIFAERGLLDSGTHAFDWTTRLKIALNIAQGLECVNKILHCKMESKDIFLTENWVPKICLSQQFPGMYKESNVYRFGVLLLELISGCQPDHTGEGSVVDLVLSLNLPCFFCLVFDHLFQS
jgi:hypothetical protein